MTHFILSSWWKIIALCWKLITFQINNLWVGKLASLIPPLALCRFIISQSCCPLKPRAQDLLFEKPEWLYAQKEGLGSSVIGMNLNVWDKSLSCPENAWVALCTPLSHRDAHPLLEGRVIGLIPNLGRKDVTYLGVPQPSEHGTSSGFTQPLSRDMCLWPTPWPD